MTAHTVGSDRVEALLAAMTLEEKVALLAGADMWTTVPVERLGIPAIKVSDGPNGARGGQGFAGGTMTSACFPVGIALASSWDTALVERIGEALAEEAQSKGAHLLLAPTVNIHRSPLNGRNFECYSEDPYLTARIAVAYITGLQRRGVGATVKHFVCNDSEFERNTISSEVDERTMREIYLPPFEAAVREAGSWAVMSSYNRVNGVYVGEHEGLLTDLLKGEWGFDGIVMSDWFGTKSTVDAANNGLDLEMPGPAQWRGAKLLAAAQAGQVRVAAIDEAARRMLRTIERAGAFEKPGIADEQAIDRPEHRALLREAAAAGIVLLKNDGDVLPIDPARTTSVAVIGPNAKSAAIMGGGSAQVNAHYAVSPFDGVTAQAGERLEIGYELGTTNHKSLPRVETQLLRRASDGAAGFTTAFYNSGDLAGEPVHQGVTSGSEQIWMGSVAPGVDPRLFSLRMVASFTPRESGAHTFSLISSGRSRVLVDGATVIDNWTNPKSGMAFLNSGDSEVRGQVQLRGGQSYTLTVEYTNEGANLLSAVRLGHLAPVASDSIARAAALAATADVAVVFVGLSGDWESEGYDRPDMELPGEQNALVEAVAAANPRTVVVVQSGSPVTMPWLDQVAAVLEAWFPGQEAGNAVADVLFGAVNPGGKLPQTFPLRVEDNPAYLNYPGDNGRVRYGEGIYVGYRYYEKKRVGTLFPFGHGLSYTSFAYSNLRLSAERIGPDDTLTVSVDVTNTGPRAGAEVVQVYVRDVAARVSRPEKELKGFAKLRLAPGETGAATVTLTRESLAFWDDGDRRWEAEAGAFEVLVGASSQDIRARATFELTAKTTFGGPPRAALALSVDTPLRILLANEAAAAVIERRLPGFAAQAGPAVAIGLTLSQAAGFAPDALPPDAIAAIGADLAALGHA